MYTLNEQFEWLDYYQALNSGLTESDPGYIVPELQSFVPLFNQYLTTRNNHNHHIDFSEYSANYTINQEQQYLLAHQNDNAEEMEIVNTHLATLKVKETADLLNGHPDDYHVLQSIKDLVQNMVYQSSSHSELGGLTVQERLRTHLHGILKSSHRNGFVFPVKYDDAIPIYIKTGDEKQGEVYENRLIPHQYFIGTIMNGMKQLIPNFMYTYGMAHTPQPLMIRKESHPLGHHYGTEYYYNLFINNVSQSPRNMLFVESINGITMHEYLTSPTTTSASTISEFTNIFMQILYSLEIAQQRYRFVHGDLHNNNILITSSSSHLITYPSQSRVRHIKTDKIAMIIDYGDSYVEVDGVGYGKFRLEHGMVPWFNQFTDVYRLIANTSTRILMLPVDNPFRTTLLPRLQTLWNYLISSSNSLDEDLTALRDHDTYYILLTPPDLPGLDYSNLYVPTSSNLDSSNLNSSNLDQENHSFSDFVTLAESVMKITTFPWYVSSDSSDIPHSLTMPEVLTTEGLMTVGYPTDLTTGYYLVSYLKEHPSDDHDQIEEIVNRLRRSPSYGEQLNSLMTQAKIFTDTKLTIEKLDKYPPINIEDPRAKPYVLNYIRLLNFANVADTIIKYVQLYYPPGASMYRRLNQKTWDRINGDSIIPSLMLYLRYDHINNINSLSPKLESLASALQSTSKSLTVPRWFIDNYYRLKDLIPSRLFKPS